MEISQLKNTITFTSVYTENYKTIHVVTKMSITEDPEIISAVFTDSSSTYDLETDGYFKLSEFTLPTSSGDGYYIIDEVVYNPSNDAMEIEDLFDLPEGDNNIFEQHYDWVSSYYLKDLYISYLQNNYLNCLCSCKPIPQQSKITVDALTMGLQLITYLTEYEQYFEIQRVIDKLSLCSNIPKCNCYG